jgi:hypothetical protein
MLVRWSFCTDGLVPCGECFHGYKNVGVERGKLGRGPTPNRCEREPCVEPVSSRFAACINLHQADHPLRLSFYPVFFPFFPLAPGQVLVQVRFDFPS